jgi:hypothetical protein
MYFYLFILQTTKSWQRVLRTCVDVVCGHQMDEKFLFMYCDTEKQEIRRSVTVL